VNEGFHVVFVRGFSTATRVTFGEKQTLTLHFVSANKIAFLVNVWVGTVHAFLIGSYLLIRWLRALDVSGGNATGTAGGNPLCIQEKHVFPA
jgi:hypothetical protein